MDDTFFEATMMKKMLITIVTLFIFPTVCLGASTYYVRAGAGGSNDGSDWTNAFTDLPATLVRDSTYYIADGSYVGYKFTTTTAAVDGTKVITIRKATVASHGTETGWDNAYGDGQAVFQQPDSFVDAYSKYAIFIGVSYITIDGVVGSGSDPDTYGIKLLQHPSYGDDDIPESYRSGYEILAIGTSLRRTATIEGIVINHVAVVGTGDQNCSDGDPYECTTDCIRAYTSPTEGGYMGPVEISDTYTYGCVNNINISGVTSASVFNNYLHDNVSDAVGAHGQNMNLDTVTGADIYNNTFIESETFVIALHNNNHVSGRESESISTNVRIYNNLFIGNGESLTGCISDMDSTTDPVMLSSSVHHNTITNMDCGAGRGFFHVGNLSDVDTQKSYAYNNLFYNVANPRLDNTGRTAGAIVHDNNAYLKCTGTYSNATETAPQVDAAASDPFTNSATGDYTISSAADAANAAHVINTGMALASTYNTDRTGTVTRPQGAAWDIGAYEYPAGGGTTYTVTPSATNCTISPAVDQETDGTAVVFTMTAAYGYTISGSGCSGSLSGSTFTTGSISADCTATCTGFGKRGVLGGTGSVSLGGSGVACLSDLIAFSYNGNESTSGTVPNTSRYCAGQTVTVSGNTGTLAKTGYTFDGWNTAADGSGTSYSPTDTFTISGATTLYAKWAEVIESWQTTFETSALTAQTEGQGGYLDRNLYPSSLLSISGSKVRLTLKGMPAEYRVASVFIGHRASSGDPWDFDGNQVRVTFDDGFNNTAYVESNTDKVSDEITFDFDKTKDFIISYCTSDLSYDDWPDGTVAGATCYYKKGATIEVDATDVAGMSAVAGSAAVMVFRKIEVFGP